MSGGNMSREECPDPYKNYTISCIITEILVEIRDLFIPPAFDAPVRDGVSVRILL